MFTIGWDFPASVQPHADKLGRLQKRGMFYFTHKTPKEEISKWMKSLLWSWLVYFQTIRSRDNALKALDGSQRGLPPMPNTRSCPDLASYVETCQYKLSVLGVAKRNCHSLQAVSIWHPSLYKQTDGLTANSGSDSEMQCSILGPALNSTVGLCGLQLKPFASY